MTTSNHWLTCGETTLLLRLVTIANGQAVPVSSLGRLGGASPEACEIILAANGLATPSRAQGQALTQISDAGWRWIAEAIATGSYRARWGNHSHMRRRIPLDESDNLSRPLWAQAQIILQQKGIQHP